MVMNILKKRLGTELGERSARRLMEMSSPWDAGCSTCEHKPSLQLVHLSVMNVLPLW